MSINKKQTVKKNISFSAIVERVHEIDNVFVKVADGALIKIRIKPVKKEGNSVLLIPRIESPVLVKKDKNNDDYIITNAGKDYDEYNIVGIDESSRQYILIAKPEINYAVIDLNLD